MKKSCHPRENGEPVNVCLYVLGPRLRGGDDLCGGDGLNLDE